jgi:electron transfer flavoprotein alpha subunit
MNVAANATDRSLLAIIVVRDGALPAGADETVAEADGNALIIGTETADAAALLTAAASVVTIEMGPHIRAMGATLVANAAVRQAHGVLMPASPDGRDLAPALAHALARPLYAAALRVTSSCIVCVRTAGRVGREYATDEPFVATFLPGLRGVDAHQNGTAISAASPGAALSGSVQSLEVLPPDPGTMDLAEAPCIVGGGLGLGTKERFDQLGRIGTAIGASLGGTRVASDAGWIPFTRQIGTTGVAVKPSTYLAFAISGATQHTSGLGHPDHIISVNLDPSCPMMTMANVAIVSDANAVLDALETKLAERVRPL